MKVITFLLTFLLVFIVKAGNVDAYGKPIKDKANVVLVFFTKDGTGLTKTWDTWYKQGVEEFKDLGFAEDEIPLHGVLFAQPSEDSLTFEKRIPSFVDTLDIVPNPEPAHRFFLLKGTRQAYAYALKRYPNATHFILVSDTTVPVKTMKHIWADLTTDPRGRFDVFCMNHREGYPKHSEWMSLRRDHAQYFVQDTEAWDKHTPVIAGICPTLTSASDEYWPLRIILEKMKLTKWEDIKREFVFYEIDTPLGTLNWHTFVDWGLYNKENVNKKIGQGEVKHIDGHPKSFSDVQSDFLRISVSLPNLWFIRKFEHDDIKVRNCANSPTKLLGNCLQTDLIPRDHPWQRLVELPKDFGGNQDCKLHEFLEKIWKYGAYHPIVMDNAKNNYFNYRKPYFNIGEGAYSKTLRASDNKPVKGDELNALLGGDIFKRSQAQDLRVVRPTMFVSPVIAIEE